MNRPVLSTWMCPTTWTGLDYILIPTCAPLLERAEAAERAVLLYQAEALRATQRAASAERRALAAEESALPWDGPLDKPQRKRAMHVPAAAVYEYPGKVCRVCGRPAPPPSGKRLDDLRVCSLERCRQEARRRDNVAKQQRSIARKRRASAEQ